MDKPMELYAVVCKQTQCIEHIFKTKYEAEGFISILKRPCEIRVIKRRSK